MSRYVLVFAMMVLPLFVRAAAAVEEPRLTAPAGRITDQAISADISAINSLQKRLADINTLGTPVATYHFAKAQAWIDMAMDQYSMNDRTSVIEDTVRQAHGLISLLEDRKSTIPMETPILRTSTMIRPDLWAKADNWKNHPGFSCGEDLVAQLEVQLVWAGHENNQLGWRHAKPYLQAAERLAKEAGRKIESCPAQRAATEKTVVIGTVVEGDSGKNACGPDPQPAPCPTCPVCAAPLTLPAAPAPSGAGPVTVVQAPTTAATVPAKLPAAPPADQVADRVHFALNRDIISPRSAAMLQRIAAVLQAHPAARIELRGNADERGHQTFNRVLSRQRAEVVRSYLVSAGIDRSRITVRAFGETTPTMRGNDIVSYARNRRVEFVFQGGAIKAEPQYEDLQVEKVKP